LKVFLFQLATGIDLDCSTGHVYWTDTTSKTIRRSNMDGSGSEVFLEQSFTFPEGFLLYFLFKFIFNKKLLRRRRKNKIVKNNGDYVHYFSMQLLYSHN
jgi:hypothetical protein